MEARSALATRAARTRHAARSKPPTEAEARPALPEPNPHGEAHPVAPVVLTSVESQGIALEPPASEPPKRSFPIEEFVSKLDPAVVKARYQIGPIDPVVVFVGDLDERHGPDLLIRAMPPILKNHPQTRLVIVGDGPMIWPLRVMSRYMLLDYAVRIVGHVGGREVRELIAAADIMAVPSRSKTEDWQILSGWSAQRPVVATYAVAEELCRHEQDSVLIYPNPGSCVWGVERVLHDPDFGRGIGQRGYARVVSEFGGDSSSTAPGASPAAPLNK